MPEPDREPDRGGQMAPLVLIAPVAVMLAIHALGMLAVSHSLNQPPRNWAEQVWGMYNITAAVALLAILGYVLRRFRDPEPRLDRLAVIAWAAAALDALVTGYLALAAFGPF